MATYYPGSTNQRETMPALYVRGPGNAPCTEPSLHGNMLFVNYPASASSVYTDGLPGSSHMHHSSSELPVPACILSPGPSLGGSALVASRIEEGYASAWGDARNEMAQHFSRPRTADDDIVLGPISHGAQVDLRTQMGILDGQKSLQQPSSVSPMQGQGLSLSLSTQIPVPSLQFQPSNSDTSFVCSHQSSAGNSLPVRDEGIHIEPCLKSLPKFAFPISNSKYLKAAQQLLDEFVNVQKSVKLKTDKSHTSCGPTKVKGDLEGDEIHKNPQQSTANPAPELSLVEKQSLQNRMTKLLAMLDEVDRRYKQYYHQIQIVVSSFDGVAGCGAAKPYTALALQTISQHFRCLRDAIDGQIRVTSRSLGEEDLSPSSGRRVGISRLRYIDQEIRQRRVFQQFGMMPQHAWRPQRGLPETSVSILRAWLFEHFLHPYPKDSDKLMLARQTGLTRSQVSNWFINARVRLWKPMIEEMYKDEFGGSELDGNLEDKPSGWKENSSSKDGSDMPNLESGSEGRELSDSSKSALAHDVQIDGAAAATGLQRELNSEEMFHMDLRLREPGRPVEDGQLLHHVLARHDEGTRYMAYEMAELGKYGNAAGVSLTLGLQHCHGGLPVSEGHQSFVAVRADGMYNPASLASEMVDYDCLGLADRQQKFSSSQLLHDFVA